MTEEADWQRGRKLLRELLPWARAEAKKGGGQFKATSALGRASLPYVTENHFDALLIYPAPLGGWHADLALKNVPPGTPNTFGTPVERPCRTRQEAEERGKRTLVAMLGVADQNKAKAAEAQQPVFLLYGGAVKLSPEVMELAREAMPEGAGGQEGGYVSQAHAIERIEATLAELFPDGFDGKSADALDLPGKVRLLTVLHIATLTGVFAYPPRRDASPSGHREQSTVRH